MEARSFFMNGPMQTIDVSGRPIDWADVLTDLEGYGSEYQLEAGSLRLIEVLKTIGVPR